MQRLKDLFDNTQLVMGGTGSELRIVAPKHNTILFIKQRRSNPCSQGDKTDMLCRTINNIHRCFIIYFTRFGFKAFFILLYFLNK